jgi:plasmid rolling circle replication initiator protein Rep
LASCPFINIKRLKGKHSRLNQQVGLSSNNALLKNTYEKDNSYLRHVHTVHKYIGTVSSAWISGANQEATIK